MPAGPFGLLCGSTENLHIIYWMDVARMREGKQLKAESFPRGSLK